MYNLNEVYGLTRDVPLNYMERSDVDQKLKENLNREKHIIIFGSSKQGKTCLRKHCLDSNKYIIVQCNNRWNITDLNANILKRAGYEVTESTKMSVGGKAKIIASINGKAKIREDVPAIEPNVNSSVAQLPEEFRKIREEKNGEQ